MKQLTTKAFSSFLKYCDKLLIDKYGTDLIGIINLFDSEHKVDTIMVLLMQFNGIREIIKRYDIYEFVYNSIYELANNKILRLSIDDLSITRSKGEDVKDIDSLLTEKELENIFDSLENNMHLYERLYKDRIWFIDSSIGRQARILITPTRFFHIMGFEERVIKENMEEFKKVFPNPSRMKSLMTDRKDLYGVLYEILNNEKNIISAVLHGELNHTFNFPKIEMKNYAFERMGILEHSSGMVFYDKSLDNSNESKTSHLKADLFLLNDFVRNYDLDFVFSAYRPYNHSKDMVMKKNKGSKIIRPTIPASDAETIFISENGENSRFLVGQLASISERVGSYHPKRFDFTITEEFDSGDGALSNENNNSRHGNGIPGLGTPDELIEFSEEDRLRMIKTIIDKAPYLDDAHLIDLYNKIKGTSYRTK